jgi:enamine deaminase RidA (YjgF/YER057c/UK114 family)
LHDRNSNFFHLKHVEELNTMSRLRVASGYTFESTHGYSRAVRAGNLVFVSGTTARGPELEGDAYVQAKAALAIIAGALAEAGAQLDSVARTVIYVVDLADIEKVARAHRESFGDVRPASTIVQVSALTPSAARVEIEITAVVDA